MKRVKRIRIMHNPVAIHPYQAQVEYYDWKPKGFWEWLVYQPSLSTQAREADTLDGARKAGEALAEYLESDNWEEVA